jgi:hypothetical protein
MMVLLLRGFVCIRNSIPLAITSGPLILSFDQYKNAGYKLLPQDGDGIDRRLGKQALIYTCMILPVLLIDIVSITP